MPSSHDLLIQAIERIQKVKDQVAHTQLHYYVFNLMGESLQGDETIEELQGIFERDNWTAYQGYDAVEAWEHYEGMITAFNRALDILQLLAREQGS